MVLDNLPPESKSKDFLVSEIGCNDGTMLNFVNELGISHIGIDPSKNVVESAIAKGINAEVAFFSEKKAKDLTERYGHANLILAANVICHIPDLNDFARGIKIFLAVNGKFMFEEPYVGSMIDKTSYDQLYDEHVYIFGATSVQKIFARHGLALVDCSVQETHGGSMRYTIMHADFAQISPKLEEVLSQEHKSGLDNFETYKEFGDRCESQRTELLSLLENLSEKGATVAGYAATSKSTTVLNYCDVDSRLISYISDSTPEKIGKFAPGSHIPIISHEEMRMNPPDFLVLFAWNHEKEILTKETSLTEQGVKWIRFVPTVEVLNI
jgi:methylation protein EvaC